MAARRPVGRLAEPAAAQEAHQRADRLAAVRQRQVAVVSARHATARPQAERVAAEAEVSGARHAEALPLPEAAGEAVPEALDAVPSRRAAAVGAPVAQHVAPVRPRAEEAAAAHAEVGEAVAVPADAEVRPPGAAAARRDAAERPAVVEAAPDAAALRPAVVAAPDAAALQPAGAAAEPVDAEAGQPGAPEACQGAGAGRPSGAASVCRRDRPRPAAVRPGRRRRMRPAQTKRCLQWTSP